MKQAHIKKPLPVKVVEALGWAYVALSVFLLVACWLFGFFWLSLSLGMVLGLRRGRRALFLSLHAIILSLVALCCVASLLHGTEPWVTWVLVLLLLLAFLLLVAPVILLCLPSSNLWFKEKFGGKAEPKGFLVCMILVLILILAALIHELICGVVIRRGNAKRGLSMAARGRELFLDMVMNDAAHKEGADWVDLAACTNSTQFVKALREKHKDGEGERTRDFGPYADIWCIAVNPPEDDSFPLIFTCNINPHELLSQVDRNWTLTCPRKWGGTCFSFCERAAVVVHGGGAAHIVSKYSRWRYIFPNGIPKLGPDTYFLTPTGRVVFAVSAAGK